MKKILVFLYVILLTACGQPQRSSSSDLYGAIVQTGSYAYTSNPDSYARKGMDKIFQNMSDTGRSEVTGCYRRIDKQTFIQIVCTGNVEVLVFGGHRSWDGAACRYDFNLKPDGNYLTTRRPECTK